MNSLGRCLRELRHLSGLKQKQVATGGMFTQGQMSKIEHDLILPDVYKLNYLAYCYGVTLDYFHPYLEKTTFDEAQMNQLNETRQMIQSMLRFQKYKELQALLENESFQLLFKGPAHTQYKNWLHGIIELEVKKNPEKSYHYFKMALKRPVLPLFREQSAEIHNSIGVYYLTTKRPDLARRELEKALKLLTPLRIMQNPKIKIRIHYNLSISDYRQGKYKSSLYHSQLALTKCEEEYSSYLVGEIYYQMGLCNYALGNKEDAKENLLHALSQFKLHGQEGPLQRTKKKLRELKLV